MRTVLLAAYSAVSFMVAADVVETPDSAMAVGLDEVVVTGSNSTVERNLLPYTVSVVDRAQLESTGATQLLSALSGRIPSLFVSQRNVFGFGVSNGGSGHIKMRGVGGDRASAVLMMVDGQPQFAGIYSHHVADFYDKEYVEKVEVLRGPGSVLYGSNAMAGVINVITRNAKQRGAKTVLTSQYGSYNTWLTSVTNTARFDRFSSLVSLSYDRTDGVVDNFDFKQADAYVKVGYDFSGNWKAGVDYTIMNFRGNDPIYPQLSNPESADVYHQNITRGETSLFVTNNYGFTGGTARVYYSYGNHYVDDPRHFHSLDDRFGVLVYQNFNPWKGSAITAGFDFDTYTGEIPMSGNQAHKPGSMSTLGRKSITEYSPYVTYSQSIADDLFVFNGGLRMANSDKFGTEWIPQAGFVVSPAGNVSFKASVAKGYRNPSFRELYLYRMANPNLEPENMMNYEVSATYSLSRYLAVDLTAYYSKGSNLIQTVDMKNENAGRFVNKGIEFSVTSRLLDNLSLSASYSYLHTSLGNLVGAPKNQYFIGVDWQVVKRFNLSADLKGTGGLYVADDVDNQNYALLNLKLTFDVCRYVSVFTRLENITDARYVINRGYEMPGFTAMGGFKLNF